MAFVLGKILADEVNRMRNQEPRGKALENGTDQKPESQIDSSKKVPPRLGPRLSRMGGLLKRSHRAANSLGGQEDHTTQGQDFSRHLTWRKIKAGWSEFKQKTVN